jgi:hypothetical protein
LPQPSQRESAAAHAVFAAIAQIGLALRESQEPVEELGSMLAHMADTLGALRSAPLIRDGQDPVAAATFRGLMEQLQIDVFAGVQRLQFYDRMAQHLSHIQRYLISVANELTSTKPEAMAQEPWDEMHAKLRERLISDAQRGLLDLFLTPDAGTRVSASLAHPDLATPGSVELF